MIRLTLEPPTYSIGEINYSPISGVIEYQSQLYQLRAREANLLLALIQSFPNVLSRTDIEEQLWKNSYATNATINQTVKALRASLGDEKRILIRTVPKEGYVLSAKPVLMDRIQSNNKKDVDCSDAASKNKPRPAAFSPLQWIYLSIVGALVFFASYSGTFTPEQVRISHKVGSNWILFDADDKDYDSIPFMDTKNTQYALKRDNQYYVCIESPEGLRCK
ncbi:winged helix-turn-helix domain-containing protein [Vibrio rotiferianus]|uniref:winged helix-turn-helix domain-containing protein n=1 Tax=Vibrio rotiferianus TaxID=190895 RepID=UPI00406AA053